jgi:hypothetical protein
VVNGISCDDEDDEDDDDDDDDDDDGSQAGDGMADLLLDLCWAMSDPCPEKHSKP